MDKNQFTDVSTLAFKTYATFIILFRTVFFSEYKKYFCSKIVYFEYCVSIGEYCVSIGSISTGS